MHAVLCVTGARVLCVLCCAQVYAMQIADTVVVAEGKGAENATLSCPKTWEKVSYTLNVGGVTY